MSIAATLSALMISLTPSASFDTEKLWQVQAQPQSAPFLSTQSRAQGAQDGEYITTPQNCTYRRTKAPGYPEMWILVLNPHHIGRPNSALSCKGMM